MVVCCASMFFRENGIDLANSGNLKGVFPMRNLNMMAPTGFILQERRFSTISNNLSNTQTVGFKKDVPVFEQLLSQADGKKTTTDTTVTVFQQGGIQKTGNQFDLAIEGEGFFKILTPEGVRYTRSGNFSLNRDQVLVQKDGYPVLGRRGEISVRGKNFEVDPGGAVLVDGQEVDRINLVTFADLGGLKKEGQTLFGLPEPQEEIEIEKPQIAQGFAEASNVNALEEMIHMMECLRIYEACSKVMQAGDEMDGKAVNEMGAV